ncbi:uncharacterized protein LOC143288923 [Babylonia areolata]|uniref:uncharacterized protein LOC143288923 n=1 Tax=Babylonia areolata TaxID=304850 RepID=UPI003FCFC19A
MTTTPDERPRKDVSSELLEAVERRQWKEVVRLVHTADCPQEERRWAVLQAAERATPWFVGNVLDVCADDQVDSVLSQLLRRRLWRCVGQVLQRGVSSGGRKRAVEEATKHADDDDFLVYILPHCSSEELEQGLSQLVSRRMWWSVDKVLKREISGEQHRWAVEQASRHARDGDFIEYILPQCHDEELEHVITHLVTRGLWRSVGEVLKRGISASRHSWVVEQSSKRARDDDFVKYILPECHQEQLEHVVIQLVSRGLSVSVDKILEQGLSVTQHRRVVMKAAKRIADSSFDRYILRHCGEDDVVAVFPHLVANKKWTSTEHVLYYMIRDTLSAWITSGHDSTVNDTLFWKFMRSCRVDRSLGVELTKAVSREIPYMNCGRYVFTMGSAQMISSVYSVSSSIAKRVSWKRALCESLMTSLLHVLCDVTCSDDMEYTDSTEHTKQCVSDIYAHITACIEDNSDSLQGITLKTIQNKQKWVSVFTEIADTHKNDPLFILHFLQGLNLYHVSRRGKNDDAMFLVILAVFPLFPQLQIEALRQMLGEQRWDVISRACLSHVWEHDRRQLFKAAVEQRQWSVVRQWSDHTVHYDERDWAMKEAFKEKEWKAYLLLIDHGLTPPEQMHAHYMVAKYGDWDTVLDMVERGGDITEVNELLENWVTGKLRKQPKGDATRYIERCEKLIRLRLRFAKNSALSPRKALERCKWGSVLFNILHQPTEDYFSQVLHKVIAEREWHILMHLVRLGMNRDERNWLFPDMVRQQQWGVCRKLLEHGVDDQLCLEALPELLEKNQWTLVARVMEYNVDDAVRRQVMQCAFHRRAGALFWHCLTLINDKAGMSAETRNTLFYRAINRDIWQAVKPLIVGKDGPVIRHRDIAFLEAIEKHLWDVVDHCQHHKADINMKDENGETPLNREARKEEWTAVKEMVYRDAQPNQLDMFGVSVLNRLIENRQWSTVKFVIKYGGNIHLPARHHEYGARRKHTPLQALIDHRQMDVIQLTVLWCGDQRKGVNDKGETTLHAACDSDRWDVMEDLMVRRVDPMAVTETGQTPLVYAALNTKCPERTVAECSKLGFSSHQPSVTGAQESLLEDVTRTLLKMWKNYRPSKYLFADDMKQSAIISPLVCAVLRGSPVLVRMLCESGSCTTTELMTLCTQLPRLTDPETEEGRRLHEEVHRPAEDLHVVTDDAQENDCLRHYSTLTQIIEKNTPLLREVVSTPRALLSSCRLLIAHRFHYSDKRRHRHLDLLPLPVPLKNYLEFSDLCDPDYKKNVQSHLRAVNTQGDE